MPEPNSEETRPRIAPVPEGGERPFWSVMIPTYNRDAYLRETLRSVLAQDPGPAEMQIGVVDNASDRVDTEALVREVGGGRVEYFRQETNVGVGGNWNTCLKRSRGHWVQVLCDDDGVLPGFYTRYRELIEAHPGAGLVFGRAVAIDENGEWETVAHSPYPGKSSGLVPDALERMLHGMWLVPPAAVTRRSMLEQVGGFDESLVTNMDWELFVRIAAAAPVLYQHHPLSLVRWHAVTASQDSARSGKAIDDMLSSLEKALDVLEPAGRAQARARMYRGWSDVPVFRRGELHRQGRHRSALRYALCCFRMNPCPANALRILKSATRAMSSSS